MASANVLNVTDATFQSEVLNSDQPVLVDFWAPWCGPCIQLGPIIDEIADAKVGTAKVAKVNVDENFQTAGQFRINSIPALLFFKGGQVRDQLVGRAPKADILAKLEALV
jgi:thioredoxin 1